MIDLAQLQAQALHDARIQLDAITATLHQHDITLGNPATGVAHLSERIFILETAIQDALDLWRTGAGDHMAPLAALSSLLPAASDTAPSPRALLDAVRPVVTASVAMIDASGNFEAFIPAMEAHETAARALPEAVQAWARESADVVQ
jgi:hypothetical protein